MFQNKLKEVRQNQGLSQLELSRMARIAPNTISVIESGQQYPFPGWRKRLAEALCVREEEVFPEEAGKKRKKSPGN